MDQNVQTDQGRILVMDDEEPIRKILDLMLTRIGYEVVTVTRGEGAVDDYRAAIRSGRPYRAVILDLTIRHGMGGLETLAGLKQIDPGVCAIVTTGSSRDAVLSSYKADGFRAVIPKPFQHQHVALAVKQALA